MILSWTENAWEDYNFWQSTDKKIVQRINNLIKDIIQNPFNGIGKPEPLRHHLAGKWSRRIDTEHRLVYEIKEMQHGKVGSKHLIILQCRYHYQ